MAENNRSVNICLISTTKDSDLDINKDGVDHFKTCIWFKDKAERDGYFASKTVKPQLKNSKIHDFMNVEKFRIGCEMDVFYKYKVDLVKVSHTKDGIEREYFYNLKKATYVNNKVVELAVSINYPYTFMYGGSDIGKIEGIVNRCNFKNQNLTIGYVNEISKLIVGSNLTDFSASSRTVIKGESKREINFLLLSLYKKKTLFDDIANKSLLAKVNPNAFTNEMVIAIPFSVSDGSMYMVNGKGQIMAEISWVAYMLLNGSINVDTSSSDLITGMAKVYQYITDLPFSLSSFYDINEIGIIPDVPYNYRIEGFNVLFDDSAGADELTVTDVMTEQPLKIGYYNFANRFKAKPLTYETITTNNDKLKMFKDFTNFENNIIYNKFILKYFNVYSYINPFNLFGSKEDVKVTTYYNSYKFKKLILSTDDSYTSSDYTDYLIARPNTDYLIPYQGITVSGGDESQMVETAMFATAGTIKGISDMIFPGTKMVSDTIGKLASDGVDLIHQFAQTPSTTTYSSNNGNVSPFIRDFKEDVGKIIIEHNERHAILDEITNFKGTKTLFYNDDLIKFIDDTISNRTNKSCYIQGDFRFNFIYPQSTKEIQALLSEGILFKRRV